jgi:CheY-like chemotaxis protein
MQSPRIVLVIESPVIALFYSCTLEGVGFTVQHFSDADSALADIREQRPACIAIDPVQPLLGAAAFVQAVRKIQNAKTVPIFVLPTANAIWCDHVLQAGATRIIARSVDAARELAEQARDACQVPPKNAILPTPPPDYWIPGVLDHLTSLRTALHSAVRETDKTTTHAALARFAHGVSELLLLGGDQALGPMASTMELLVDDLPDMPEQFMTSVLRSIGQAADFIGARLTDDPPVALPPTEGSHVLIVDDDSGACMLITATMQSVGLVADSVLTPTECLAAVQASRYDVILLDIRLPEMTGFDVCSHVRNSPGHDSVPILFLTGMTTFQNRAQSTLSGGNDFIGKPFHPTEIALKALLWINQGRLRHPQ